MTIPLYQVDSFTGVPFAGNPAGVCVLAAEPPEAWMQSVAAEMNLAETAFLWPRGPGFGLRWFTPTVEVDLCGHATLAASHILWERQQVPAEQPIQFTTRSGPLHCVLDGERIAMDFPAEPAAAAAPPPELILALGKYPVWSGKNRMDYLLELKSEAAVRELAPDLAALSRVPARGVIVTARSETAGVDFVSRFFAPQSGVPEDPVTGSAHCALGPYWHDRLQRNPLTGLQCSRRGGLVHVECRGDRVVLAGHAVTVFSAQLSGAALPPAG